ncbi:MAG: Replication-associated recombination protein RarA [uncultured Solirubrobacteraceae bacterium]|uniref:Replication-associated recombination protein RarA n=1 Tax=uncultured Solirubrobacteraceae bacterium TaxID=1162706 RepID=A0A6J4RH60_9ACTN|nr:MAG: Replication-associated recombination protein RarA [uncultured Solirubrobacteraceae bacterium]
MDAQLTIGATVADSHQPLAERMRPRTLDEVVGQPQLTGPDSPLRTALAAGAPHSMVLWGPPGTGKTTIALLVAAAVDADVEQLNAVTDGIKELRAVIGRAEDRRALGRQTLLFIDEIARWNKAQQDALLPYVENGTVVLVGSTTENPGFELNRALVSRLQLHVVRPLEDGDLAELVRRALSDAERGVGIPAGDERPPYSLAGDALEHLLLVSGGDARRLLGTIERAAQLTPAGGEIDVATIERAAGQRAVSYDKGADEHYGIISAFIKSIRGSDPDAALYWLARMEAGGEAPEFIARRLVIAASEEVGTAASGALTVAVSGMQAVKMIGPPECWLHLAHVTAYLARSPKSWAAYQGLGAARRLVAERPHYPVPAHLRNPTTALDRRLGHGEGYVHASQPGGEAVEFLPPELRGTSIYEPSGNGQDR